MSEMKRTLGQLEEENKALKEQLDKVVAIANLYIKAHRDLLTQIRTAHDTSANYEVLLSEKLK